MTMFTVDMKWIRAVATWQPITKNTGGNSPILEGVNVAVNGTEIVTTVTDRYRIVYAVTENTGDVSVSNVNVIVPMSMIVSFAAGNKNVVDDMPVVIEVTDDDTTISSNGSMMSGATIRGQYPRVWQLVQEWQPNDTGDTITFNMKLLADVVKFANPREGVPTAARRNNLWDSVRGGTSGKTWRFDTGNPDVFGVVIQSGVRYK